MYILIVLITILNIDGTASTQTLTSIEFQSEKTCIFAREALRKQERVNTVIDIGCLKK
jgi:hypothetical protein